MSERTDIAAYQLSLLGDPPKPGKVYVPTVYVLRFGGMAFPLNDDTKRQLRMLTADTGLFT